MASWLPSLLWFAAYCGPFLAVAVVALILRARYQRRLANQDPANLHQLYRRVMLLRERILESPWEPARVALTEMLELNRPVYEADPSRIYDAHRFLDRLEKLLDERPPTRYSIDSTSQMLVGFIEVYCRTLENERQALQRVVEDTDEALRRDLNWREKAEHARRQAN